jgi:SAM-dependent methyltransferase
MSVRHLLAAGRGAEAVGELTAALASGTADIDAARLLARLLGRYRLEPSPQVEAALRAACHFADIDLQPFVRPVIDCLFAKPAWRAVVQTSQTIALDAGHRALFGDPLLHAVLTRCICHDVALERILIALRAALLFAPAIPDGWTPIVAALAQQAANNEYAWPTTPEEDDSLSTADALRAAMYRAPPFVAPDDEAALRAGIGRLSVSAVSEKVQAQYEENPYPRWLALNPPEPGERRAPVLAHCLAAARPRFAGSLDILIAGCGTGRQAVTAYLGYGAPIRMVAIDLSLASLVYAKRMARRYDAGDIEFIQADILEADRLEREFDVIEAIGVLHHLADPVAGWRALARRLRPDGLMHVALYSERGRQDIVAAQAAIAGLGLASTPAGMRRLRRLVLDAPGDAQDWRTTVGRFTDFFTLSGCRDLLFHVQEHRFTPLAVGEAVAALGLEFCGFDVRAAMRKLYREKFPDDPDGLKIRNWDAFEAENPRLFSRMIGLWCRKPH